MYIYYKYKCKKLFLKHEQHKNITNTKHDKVFKCTDNKHHALLIEDKTFFENALLKCKDVYHKKHFGNFLFKNVSFL